MTWTPVTLDAGGTDNAVTASAAAVDVFEFISDGTSWYSYGSSKNVS